MIRMITFNDFKKIKIRTGKILSAEEVPGAEKLIKINVDLGKEKKQIVAGILEFYNPNELKGKIVPVIVNLEPRKIRGIKSEGMILLANKNKEFVLLHPEKEVPPGCEIE